MLRYTAFECVLPAKLRKVLVFAILRQYLGNVKSRIFMTTDSENFLLMITFLANLLPANNNHLNYLTSG